MNNLKGVLRLTIVIFLLVGLVCIWMGGCQTQEQKIERLIKQLQDQDSQVRGSAGVALGDIGPEAKDAVPALIQALQNQHEEVRGNAAEALMQIGTPEALKAVEDFDFESRQ